jgi:hypothetical protein
MAFGPGLVIEMARMDYVLPHVSSSPDTNALVPVAISAS